MHWKSLRGHQIWKIIQVQLCLLEGAVGVFFKTGGILGDHLDVEWSPRCKSMKMCVRFPLLEGAVGGLQSWRYSWEPPIESKVITPMYMHSDILRGHQMWKIIQVQLLRMLTDSCTYYIGLEVVNQSKKLWWHHTPTARCTARKKYVRFSLLEGGECGSLAFVILGPTYRL